jgi:alkylation response protein AidB-like acyl-CoA dehydrogenase
MDFTLTTEEEVFKKELNDWLNENLIDMPEWWGKTNITSPNMELDEIMDFYHIWHKKLYKAGFVGITWPKEYGGRSGTLVEQWIFNEQMAKRRAPPILAGLGLGWAGPTILLAGTEEQKKRFLPRILSGDDHWCQAFSEPEAGSDLANTQTRAVEDGDDFIINGQKVWTTGAMRSDWAILLARTDASPDVPRHKGLTYFLLDMKTPGVKINPMREMNGDFLFCETFLDDVRIPKSLVVGEVNQGWYISMRTLEFERTNSNSANVQINTILNLIDLVRTIEKNCVPLSQNPIVRQKIAQFYIEANVCKYIGLRTLTRQIRGIDPGPESAVGSLMSMELNQRLQEFAMYLEEPYSRLVKGSKYAIDDGRWQRSFLSSRGDTIMTGTSQIKRNIIAQRALGLPR